MKKKGFTLIELLAVIVILAVIALIATPLIMGTITNAKKNAFKDTAYGILKAGEKYTAETLLASENTYSGEMITIPETGKKKLNYKGQEPRGGQMIITKNGDISLVIYNDSWCAIKNARDKEVSVEKYNKDTCKVEIPLLGLAQRITDKNTIDNTEGLFTDDYGNIRYRGSNDEVKNYVTFHGESWRIIGVFEGKVKLIRNESLDNMKWDENSSNNWKTSTLNTYLNGEYYNSLSSNAKNQIETNTFYLGGHNTTAEIYTKTMYQIERGTDVYSGNPITIKQNIGLMYPSDYGYAARNACSKALSDYNQDINCKEGNWLYLLNAYQWLQTSSTGGGIYVFTVYGSGFIYSSGNINYEYGVRPVVYLKSSTGITAGDGTQSNPYIIE